MYVFVEKNENNLKMKKNAFIVQHFWVKLLFALFSQQQ